MVNGEIYRIIGSYFHAISFSVEIWIPKAFPPESLLILTLLLFIYHDEMILSRVPMHRSEFIKNNLSPLWNETKLDLSTLCDGDVDMALRLVVYDHEGSGKHKLIGSVETSVNEFLGAKRFGGGGDINGDDEANYLLLEDRKGKDAGSISVINAAVTGVPEPEDFSGDECDDE